MLDLKNKEEHFNFHVSFKLDHNSILKETKKAEIKILMIQIKL
jgi:hypothetical protein